MINPIFGSIRVETPQEKNRYTGQWDIETVFYHDLLGRGFRRCKSADIILEFRPFIIECGLLTHRSHIVVGIGN